MEITLQTLAAVTYKNKQILRDISVPEPCVSPEPAEILETDKKVSIALIKTPRTGMKGLVQIRQQLKLDLSIGELLNKAHQIPFNLLEDVSFSLYGQRCADIIAAEDCIEIIETSSGKVISTASIHEFVMDRAE